LVLVTHDETTFNANDGKRGVWLKDGKQPIRPKGRGKGTIVSGFSTLGGRLRVPDSVHDNELLEESGWPLKDDGTPVRDAMQFLEYGKDNYWAGDKMVDHTIQIAIPIFKFAFPDCEALFAFDNASHHCAFAEDALLASRMNRNPGGKQSLLRPDWIGSPSNLHSMIFPDDHPEQILRGKAKGVEQVLREGLKKLS